MSLDIPTLDSMIHIFKRMYTTVDLSKDLDVIVSDYDKMYRKLSVNDLPFVCSPVFPDIHRGSVTEMIVRNHGKLMEVSLRGDKLLGNRGEGMSRLNTVLERINRHTSRFVKKYDDEIPVIRRGYTYERSMTKHVYDNELHFLHNKNIPLYDARKIRDTGSSLEKYKYNIDIKPGKPYRFIGLPLLRINGLILKPTKEEKRKAKFETRGMFSFDIEILSFHVISRS